MVEVLVQLRVVEQAGVLLAQVFARGHEKTAGAAGRVADGVGGGGRGHFHHQLDDVAWRTELAVLPCAGDLAEHVFVKVALGVAVVHGHGVEQVDHFGQQRGRGDGEARVFHVLRVGGTVAAVGVGAVRAQGAQHGEHVFAHGSKHLGRGFVLEAAPAQGVVVAAFGVVAEWEDVPRHGAAQAVGLVFFERVQVVEPAQEEQVGDLLDDFERVGDAAGPEGVPDLVDFAFEVAGEHRALGMKRTRLRRGGLLVGPGALSWWSVRRLAQASAGSGTAGVDSGADARCSVCVGKAISAPCLATMRPMASSSSCFNAW